MKLKFLGTAAAEGIPAFFCPCPVCETARSRGGREIRTRSGALIDGEILLDFPPDTYAHMLRFDLPLHRIASLLVTHTHTDHFAVRELELRHRIFANLPAEAPALTVYGGATVGETLRALPLDLTGRVAFAELKAFESADIGGYTVTPLRADHMKDEDCFIYHVERGGRRLLYAHDTGDFPEDTWRWLAGRNIGLVSLDCTFAGRDYSRGHMGFPANLRVRDRMRAVGAAVEKTIFVCNHFSHNGGMNHAELVEMARPEGFAVAWDGMEAQPEHV